MPTMPFKQQYAGGLTTLSYRGTSAEQQAILWDGINLNSAFLGLFDLSNLPLLGNHTYSGISTANTLIDANGTMGIRLNLNTKNNFEKDNIIISNQVASFGTFSNQVSTSFTDGKNNIQLNTLYQKAKNSYTYTENGQKKRVDNADFNFWDVHAKWATKFNYNWRLQTDFWVQNHFRNVPFAANKPFLIDEAIRAKSHLSYNNSSIHLKAAQTIAFFNESINYNDDISELNRFISQSRLTKKWYRIELDAKLNYEYQQAITQNYLNTQTRNLITPNLKLKYNYKKAELFIINSTTLIDKQTTPVNLKFIYQQHLSKKATINYLFTRNSRLPTFNELYWNPGGNENLQAENGYENEVSFSYWTYPPKRYTLKHSFNASIYHRLVNNLVQWARIDNPYFEAQNLKKVRSWGIEFNYNLYQKSKHHKNELSISGGYINSAIADDLKYFLPYIPKLNLTTNYKYTYKQKNTLFIEGLVNSKQYTTNDNSSFIKAYGLLNAGIIKSFAIDNHQFETILTINNLLNQSYQTFSNRPAIGRNFSLTIKLNLQ